MDTSIVYAVKSGLSWLVVGLSVLGYVLTWKRARQKWMLWVVLGAAWAIMAIPNTLLGIGVAMAERQLAAVWLTSYVLVAASLVLLFLKIIELTGQRKRLSQRTHSHGA
jgi:hypothetical protein